MKKVVLASILASAFAVPMATAGVLDAITGHINDLSTRYTDDRFLEGGRIVSEGMFRPDDKGSDFLHNVNGSAYIIKKDDKYYIQLGADFESTVAPDLYLYASEDKQIVDEVIFMRSNQVEIGKLVKSRGASYYEIQGINPKYINSVTIWCKSFSEFMGSADIK